MIKVVNYINQFFAGIGGEDKADIKPHVAESLPPISVKLQSLLGEGFEVVATVVCGDTYFNENLESASSELLEMIKTYHPDLFIAGPAFNAGRYGVAAGTITSLVQKKLNIKCVTGMYIENPGVDMFKKEIYIIETTNSASGMRKSLPKIATFAKKLISNKIIGSPKEEGYIERGMRVNFFHEDIGAKRAVDMLIQKINEEEFDTEYKMPVFDRVTPAKPLTNLQNAKIALVTSGGIVPKGNPDRIESSSASKYGEYSLVGFNDLNDKTHETAHGGYDPVYANLDPDRVLPVDIMRELVHEKIIGSLHEIYYATVGNGTAVASAKAYANEIANKLKINNVDAVILTST